MWRQLVRRDSRARLVFGKRRLKPPRARSPVRLRWPSLQRAPTRSAGRSRVFGIGAGACRIMAATTWRSARAAAFTFSTAISSGAAYSVTVLTQPAGQSCTVTNGSGTASANVTNVQVACSIYHIHHRRHRLWSHGTGWSCRIMAATTWRSARAAAFTFSTAISSGAAYSVTVLTQPAGQSLHGDQRQRHGQRQCHERPGCVHDYHLHDRRDGLESFGIGAGACRTMAATTWRLHREQHRLRSARRSRVEAHTTSRF